MRNDGIIETTSKVKVNLQQSGKNETSGMLQLNVSILGIIL